MPLLLVGVIEHLEVGKGAVGDAVGSIDRAGACGVAVLAKASVRIPDRSVGEIISVELPVEDAPKS
jgi:hypothetical protein